jgi:hypothetical protein
MTPKFLIAEDHAGMRAKVVSLLERHFEIVANVGGEQLRLKRRPS